MALVDYQLDRSPFDNQLDWSPVNYQLDLPTVESQLTSFSKSPNSQPIASGHDVVHTLAPISYLGFIMTIVIVISSARERKLYPMPVPPELRTE